MNKALVFSDISGCNGTLAYCNVVELDNEEIWDFGYFDDWENGTAGEIRSLAMAVERIPDGVSGVTAFSDLIDVPPAVKTGINRNGYPVQFRGAIQDAFIRLRTALSRFPKWDCRRAGRETRHPLYDQCHVYAGRLRRIGKRGHRDVAKLLEKGLLPTESHVRSISATNWREEPPRREHAPWDIGVRLNIPMPVEAQ